jgi:hypothetical protein
MSAPLSDFLALFCTFIEMFLLFLCKITFCSAT